MRVRFFPPELMITDPDINRFSAKNEICDKCHARLVFDGEWNVWNCSENLLHDNYDEGIFD